MVTSNQLISVEIQWLLSTTLQNRLRSAGEFKLRLLRSTSHRGLRLLRPLLRLLQGDSSNVSKEVLRPASSPGRELSSYLGG